MLGTSETENHSVGKENKEKTVETASKKLELNFDYSQIKKNIYDDFLNTNKLIGKNNNINISTKNEVENDDEKKKS